MRTRGIGWIFIVAALGAMSPGLAVAFDFEGHLGLGYDRVDSWNGPEHAFVPSLRLNGDLSAGGFVVAPGIVDWAARLGYNNFRNQYAETENQSDALSYRASVDLLRAPESRVGLSASATRARSNYSTDVGTLSTTGSAIGDGYSVNGKLVLPGLPNVTSGFSYASSRQWGYDRPETTQVDKAFDLGGGFGGDGLTSSVGYLRKWGEGTLVPVNYTQQLVNFVASMSPTEGIMFSDMSAAYGLREPTVLAAGNPRFEDARVDARVGWRGTDRTKSWAGYGYRHASSMDPSLPLREYVDHDLSANRSWRASAEWDWGASAMASFRQERLGTQQSPLAAGQSVGITASWSRPNVGAAFGASGGGFEAPGASAAIAYGANASGRASRQRANRTYSATYSVDYRSNLNATAGWATTQSLFADVMETTGAFLMWQARLQASGARGGGGTFGSSANRSLVAQGSVTYRRSSLLVQLGMIDAATGALSNPLSDGLFLPTAYDTHSRYAGVTASYSLSNALTAQASAKYTVLSGPATPDQREAALAGSLAYAIGYWALSLSDSYSMGGTTSFDRRVNLLSVQLSRTLGAR